MRSSEPQYLLTMGTLGKTTEQLIAENTAAKKKVQCKQNHTYILTGKNTKPECREICLALVSGYMIKCLYFANYHLNTVALGHSVTLRPHSHSHIFPVTHSINVAELTSKIWSVDFIAIVVVPDFFTECHFTLLSLSSSSATKHL